MADKKKPGRWEMLEILEKMSQIGHQRDALLRREKKLRQQLLQIPTYGWIVLGPTQWGVRACISPTGELDLLHQRLDDRFQVREGKLLFSVPRDDDSRSYFALAPGEIDKKAEVGFFITFAEAETAFQKLKDEAETEKEVKGEKN